MVANSIIHVLKDSRVNCYSVMTVMRVGDYLRIVTEAYQNRGGIEGQRDSLKTNTAIRIRQTMIKDLTTGAVLPPVVLGAVLSESQMALLQTAEPSEISELLQGIQNDQTVIIDGMQRTTALLEVTGKVSEINEREMWVEYWIASSTNSLIYRMLVLNTGQVPWNLRRQIEVVFKSMIKEIGEKVTSIQLLAVDESKRRTKSGQFQVDRIIELFLVFGARKHNVIVKEKLAEEFTRLDFIEASSDNEFTETFYKVLQCLVDFDKALGKYFGKNAEGRFSEGNDLFSSQPACIGYMTAAALDIFGRPGEKQRTQQEQQAKLSKLQEHAKKLVENLSAKSPEEIEQFLDFPTLNELFSEKRPGSVGDFERDFFLKAFQALIEEKFDLESMTLCWRAY